MRQSEREEADKRKEANTKFRLTFTERRAHTSILILLLSLSLCALHSSHFKGKCHRVARMTALFYKWISFNQWSWQTQRNALVATILLLIFCSVADLRCASATNLWPQLRHIQSHIKHAQQPPLRMTNDELEFDWNILDVKSINFATRCVPS